MRSYYCNLNDCHTATGTVIAIDVMRAFSTAAYAFSMSAKQVLLGGGGDEDLACANSLEALLKDERPNLQPFIQRVLASKDEFQHFNPTKIGFPITDLDYCTQTDKFDFAMPIERNDGRLIMYFIKP
jgi:2-phosphosulfolactate phosphatase